MIRIFPYVFEMKDEVFGDSKAIAEAEKASDFAIKKRSTDIGIISENLSEVYFPCIPVSGVNFTPQEKGALYIARLKEKI